MMIDIIYAPLETLAQPINISPYEHLEENSIRL